MRHGLHRLRFWLLWPALWFYFRISRRARVLLRYDNKVVVIRDRSKVWFDDDSWALPGGGIKRSETPVEGAIRELYEELGIRLSPEQFQLLGHEWSGNFGLRYRAYFYLVALPAEPQASAASKEIAAVTSMTPLDLISQPLKLETRRALQLAGLAQ